MRGARHDDRALRNVLAALVAATSLALALAPATASARQGEVRVDLAAGIVTSDAGAAGTGHELLGEPVLLGFDAGYFEWERGLELSFASELEPSRWTLLAGPRLRTRPRPVSWSVGLKAGVRRLDLPDTRFAFAPDVGAEIELGPLFVGVRDALVVTVSPSRVSNRLYAVLGFWF
jgi:hypothetical protein